MAFTPVIAGDRVIPQGVWERARLCAYLQADDTGALEAWLTKTQGVWMWKGGNLPAEWQPHYWVIHAGSSWEIVLQGTENRRQIMLHAGGVAYTEAHGEGIVNSLWWRVTNDLANEIEPILGDGPDRGEPVTIDGHSYGGAIAGLMAILLKQRHPRWDISVCTFGAPRSRGDTWTEAIPQNWVRVVADGDVIPCLPGPGMTIRPSTILAGVLNRKSQTYYWRHDGIRYVLVPGSVPVQRPRGEDEDQFAWNRDVATWEARHPISNYDDLTRTAPGVTDTTVTGRLSDEQLRAILGQPPAQFSESSSSPGLLAKLNGLYFKSTDGPITAANVAQFETVQSSVGDANPLPPTNIGERVQTVATFSNFTKVTMCINNGRTGRQETHVINLGMGTMNLLRPRVEALMKARAALLGNGTAGAQPSGKSPASPQIEFVKLQDAVQPKLGMVLDYSDQKFYGPANTAAWPADFSSVALSTRLTGTEFLDPNTGATPSKISNRSANLQIGYQPDDAVTNGIWNESLTRNTVAFEYQRALTNYIRLLISGTPAWGFMGLNDNEARVALSGWGLDPTKTFWQFTAAGATWGVGERIRITKTNPVFNGTYVISNVAGGVYQVSRQPVTGHTPPVGGFGQRVKRADGVSTLAFYDYTGGNTDPTGKFFGFKASKKNPGREFLSVSFFHRKRRER